MSQMVEFDCNTGIQTVRDLTAEEITSRRAQIEAHEAENLQQAEEKARVDALKESAKAKLVAGQPLTEEEASVLTL